MSYPSGPQGWGSQGAAWQTPPQDTSHNWMGVVALVAGICGAIVFAYIFGFLGLNAARRGQADNKMMSIGGIVVASMYVLAIVVAVSLL
jgi:uncharacterized membrane protein